MKIKLFGLIVMLLLLSPAMKANAEVNVSIGIGLPNLSIGINLPMYPTLAPVPGYPVYYAPEVSGNYFFYDSMYWVYQDDNWYASSWYNGPWGFVEPMSVPVYVLRIPVRYYRQPPVYFRGWQPNAPPRWGQHWGNDWEHRRRGWDRWDRKRMPARAPQPVYQRQYSGDRYPHVERQHELRNQSYRYQPRDKNVRRHMEQQRTYQPDQRGREQESQGNPRQIEQHRPDQRQHGAPPNQHSQPPQRGGEQRVAPGQPSPQQRGPAQHEQKQHEQKQREQKQQPAAHQPQQREQQPPRQEQRQEQKHEQRQQERGSGQDSGRGHGQGQDRDDDRGRGR